MSVEEKEGLPEGWMETTFGGLNQYSSSNIDPAQFPSETFELYSVPNFPKGEPEFLAGVDIGSTKQSIAANDVLVCKINPRINRVWQVPKAGKQRQIGSSEWIVFRSPGTHAGFYKHFFRSFEFRELLCTDLTGVGGSLTRAQPTRVATFPLPLPPLPEQIRIADKLDALLARVEAGRERLERVPKLVKQFRQAVLSAAVSGELTREWREDLQNTATKVDINFVKREHQVFFEENNHKKKYRLPTDPYNDDLPEIPTTWIWVSVEQIAQLVTDGDHNPPKRVSGGIPHLTAKNVNKWKIDYENCTYISEMDFEVVRKRYNPMLGDLIITCVGTIGRTAIVESDRKFSPDRNLASIRVIPGIISRYFLQLVINTTYIQNIIFNASGSTAQPHLYLSDIRRLPIPLPPLSEQAEIVRRVEALFALADRLESRYQSALTSFDRLTPALLAKAFRGELVPQDPNDEPASVLLERIRAQRAAEGSKPKRGRGAASGSIEEPKRRGRPPKAQAEAGEQAPSAEAASQTPDLQPPRRRGRPPKARPEAQAPTPAAIPKASSYEDAVRKLEALKLERAGGTRQVSLFDEEPQPS